MTDREQSGRFETLKRAQRRIEKGNPRRTPNDARIAIRRAIDRREVEALVLLGDEWEVIDRDQLARARIDFVSSRVELPEENRGAPAAPAPIRLILPESDDTALEPPPPSDYPEPPPEIAEPVYPSDVLAQGLTIGQREATEANYQRKKRAYDEAWAAWRTREEQRKNARSTWEKRHRARQTSAPPTQSAAKDGFFGPLIVVAVEDIERIANPSPAPLAAQIIPAPETDNGPAPCT